MIILQFIRQYWIIIALTGAFMAGWHLKSLMYVAAENRALISQAKLNDKAATHFEKIEANIEEKYNNLNTKVTYADAYSCVIPADGLRLLAEATGKTR